MDKIKEFFGPVYANLGHEDSIAILTFLGISFLLGLIFGAWSRARKIRRLKRELGEKETELKNLKTQYDTLVEQYEKKEEALRTSESKVVDLTADVNRLTNERLHYKTELESARQHLEQLQAENLEYATRIGGGSDEVLGTIDTNYDDDLSGNEVVSDRLSLIEEKLEKLALENANLRDEVSALENNAGTVTTTTTTTPTTTTSTSTPVIIGSGSTSIPSTSGSGSTGISTSGEDPVLDLSNEGGEVPPSFEEEILEEDFGEMSPQESAERAKASIVAAIGSKIPSALEADKDDLKKIDGVGPFIEQKLNDIGIYTFEQVSMLDSELIKYVTDAIQFFPGRIEKDDWVGQAKSYMG